jgi:hypothetical protein
MPEVLLPYTPLPELLVPNMAVPLPKVFTDTTGIALEPLITAPGLRLSAYGTGLISCRGVISGSLPTAIPSQSARPSKKLESKVTGIVNSPFVHCTGWMLVAKAVPPDVTLYNRKVMEYVPVSGFPLLSVNVPWYVMFWVTVAAVAILAMANMNAIVMNRIRPFMSKTP